MGGGLKHLLEQFDVIEVDLGHVGNSGKSSHHAWVPQVVAACSGLGALLVDLGGGWWWLVVGDGC